MRYLYPLLLAGLIVIVMTTVAAFAQPLQLTVTWTADQDTLLHAAWQDLDREGTFPTMSAWLEASLDNTVEVLIVSQRRQARAQKVADLGFEPCQ